MVSSRAQRWGGVNFDDLHYERTAYDPEKAYAQSKSANILFAVELDRRAKGCGIRAFAAHPGLVPMTDLGSSRIPQNASGFTKGLARLAPRIMKTLNVTAFLNLLKKPKPHHVGDEFKNTRQGAATPVWCAVSSELNAMGGVYCEDCNIAYAVDDGNSPYGVLPWAIDRELAVRLWAVSEPVSAPQ